MLPGKKFGRRHEGCLRAGFNRACHGQQRDNGFATADVALEQAEHAVGAGKIVIDRCEGIRLSARQSEGQGILDCFADLARRLQPPPGAFLEALSDNGERKLVGQKLVIGQPRPCC